MFRDSLCELDKFITESMKNPEFRRGFYQHEYSNPLPIHQGAEYRRRRRRR